MIRKPDVRPLATALVCAAIGAGAALAQDAPPPSQGVIAPAQPVWDKKRLDRLERNLDRLENTMARTRPDRAPPDLIEPDPEVMALTARVDELSGRVGDLEQALKRVNGQLDSVSLELDHSHKAEADSRARADALAGRLTELEGRLAKLEQAAAAAPPAPAPGAPYAADAGPAPAAPDPAADFKAAAALLRAGDNEGGVKAFEAWLSRWPKDAQAPEAHYLLGEGYYAEDHPDAAAREYYLSIKGWPKARWAPVAMVRLAATLDAQHQAKQACAAIAEFDKRYAKEAAGSLKSQAAAIRTRNKCSA